MVSLDQIYLAETGGSSQVDGEVLDIWQGVPVRPRDGVEGSVIAAGAPVTGFLRDHMQWRGPLAFRWASDPDIKHVLKLCLCDLEFLGRQSSRTEMNGRACRLDVVDYIVANGLSPVWWFHERGKFVDDVREWSLERGNGWVVHRWNALGKAGERGGAQLSRRIYQRLAVEVHEQAEVMEEIGSYNAVSDRCGSKNPPEGSAKPQG